MNPTPSLIELINQYITTNGQSEITGQVLNNVLQQIVTDVVTSYITNGQGSELFDLDVADPNGHVILRLKNGGIITKYFNSFEMPGLWDTTKADLDITDPDGNVILRLKNGGIITKNFNSLSTIVGQQWKGKKWYAYGTSITENTVANRGHYTDVVASISELLQYNKGIGGGGITTSSNQRVYNAVMDANDGKVNADLVTLEVGANDAGAPIGTIYDETASTWCGALNLCIRALQTMTKAQIVIISSPNAAYNLSTHTYATPQSTYGSDNHTKYDQWKATREVCKLNSVYYIPMGEDAGLGWARLKQDYDGSHQYIIDEIHPTPLGASILGHFVWSRLQIIPNF